MDSTHKNAIDIYNTVINNYTLQQIKSEWITFIDFLIEIQPKIVVEIGTYAGGSTFTFAHFTDLIVSVDDNDKFRKRPQIKALSELVFINKTSKKNSVMQAVETALSSRQTLADLLFIDGEHTYKGAKRDFNSYKKFVKPGGYIALHDILKSSYHVQQHCLVYKFWQELKNEYPNYKEILNTKQKWGGIGIVKI